MDVLEQFLLLLLLLLSLLLSLLLTKSSFYNIFFGFFWNSSGTQIYIYILQCVSDWTFQPSICCSRWCVFVWMDECYTLIQHQRKRIVFVFSCQYLQKLISPQLFRTKDFRLNLFEHENLILNGLLHFILSVVLGGEGAGGAAVTARHGIKVGLRQRRRRQRKALANHCILKGKKWCK